MYKFTVDYKHYICRFHNTVPTENCRSDCANSEVKHMKDWNGCYRLYFQYQLSFKGT